MRQAAGGEGERGHGWWLGVMMVAGREEGRERREMLQEGERKEGRDHRERAKTSLFRFVFTAAEPRAAPLFGGFATSHDTVT
eukprot:2316940-Rhodomonas_salina.4